MATLWGMFQECFQLLVHCLYNAQVGLLGSRRYSADLPQGGLELPCVYTFSRRDKVVAKVKKLLTPVDILNSPPKKKPKVDDKPAPPERKPWLTCHGIQLFDEDRVTLCSEQLTDLHVDFAQELLKQQYLDICGLQSVHLPPTPGYKIPKLNNYSLFLQVLHSRGNHWIVVSALGRTSSVKVYDSLYKTVDDETKRFCVKVFGPNRNIENGTCTQQEGCIDCGVHAIATCTALAHHMTPIFSRQGMRDHLINCFEKFSMTPFM